MSLIIGTRFKGGILIASDPFFFDNQGIAPSKGIRFKRFLISKALSFGMAAAGSLWVFEKTKEWFSSFENSNPDDFLVPLSSKWKELNRHWINNREHQVSETGFGTLLPISNSLFILGMSNDLSCICGA